MAHALRLLAQSIPCFVIAAILTGCGGSESVTSSADAKASAKDYVLMFTEEVKKDSKLSHSNPDPLVESVQAWADDYGAEFQPLLTESQALSQLLKSGAPKSEIDAQLEKLEAAANAL